MVLPSACWRRSARVGRRAVRVERHDWGEGTGGGPKVLLQVACQGQAGLLGEFLPTLEGLAQRSVGEGSHQGGGRGRPGRIPAPYGLGSP